MSLTLSKIVGAALLVAMTLLPGTAFATSRCAYDGMYGCRDQQASNLCDWDRVEGCREKADAEEAEGQRSAAAKSEATPQDTSQPAIGVVLLRWALQLLFPGF